MRRGGRVVDRAALEMRSTGDRTGGSNPSLSASSSLLKILRLRIGAQNPQYSRGSDGNLCTAGLSHGPEIRSLSAKFSEALDCAILYGVLNG